MGVLILGTQSSSLSDRQEEAGLFVLETGSWREPSIVRFRMTHSLEEHRVSKSDGWQHIVSAPKVNLELLTCSRIENGNDGESCFCDDNGFHQEAAYQSTVVVRTR